MSKQIDIQIIKMVVKNSICHILSAILDNPSICFVFIKLRGISLGLIHMSAWTNFQLWSWVSNEKPKQTMEEWQSVAEFYTNYSNASIYLFNQFGELKRQFSSFLDPPQWPHTWFPLRVSISYRLNVQHKKIVKHL